MSIEVSHLVFNGCSFTYCQGLDDPKTEGWPALLGKTLGLPVVNLAVGGSGNDAIQRRTYEYHYKNKKKYPKSKPFYIFGFSGATRREEFFKKYNNLALTDFISLELEASAVDLVSTLSNADEIHKIVEYGHLMNLSLEVCERKKFLCWNSILNLCNASNIPYITADYLPTVDKDVIKYMLSFFPEMYTEALQDRNYLGKANQLTAHIKEKLPCGHEPKESMPIIHDAFYKKILEVYGEIKVINEKFLSLDQYYSIATKNSHMRTVHVDWF